MQGELRMVNECGATNKVRLNIRVKVIGRGDSV